MAITTYIEKQLPDRQHLLKKIHEIIIAGDRNVDADVEFMMGKEMIIYKAKGMFKYGLSSVKNYISLHVLPIYASPELHDKYKKLLPAAKFQKGCINFTGDGDLPLEILQSLVNDCSRIDLAVIRENYLKSKGKK